MLCLCVTKGAQAQIDDRYHWYDGTITYTASHIGHNNVKMYGMDEGEEHEFVLRYIQEKNPEHQVYAVADDNVGYHRTGVTAHRQKAEGLDVICIYDSDDRLKTVMSGETEWDAEVLNSNRWLNQIIGTYIANEKSEYEKCIVWTMETLAVNGIVYPYDIITFNGRATGYIRVEEVPGALNELEGMWEVKPTLNGMHLYAVNTETGNTPWEWEHSGTEYEFTRTDLQSGRFDYASRILLNDMQFRRFDKKTLRIMRNEILARHGYRFQSKDLQEYFGKQSWYKPVKDNSKIRLSFVEQLNVELIKYIEAEQ